MASDPRNLPVSVPPLDRAALERVLARAAELQAREGDPDDPGLTDAQLVEIARDVGLSPANLRQALAEERSRPAPAAGEGHGTMDLLFGPATASAARTVSGDAGAIMARLDGIMQREEGLRVKRRFGDRTSWERAPGIVANLSRALDLSGRGYHLTRADEVAATAIPVDDGRTLVRMQASLHALRRGNIAGGSFLAAMGAVGTGFLLLVGAAPVIAATPLVLFAALGWLAARGHRRARLRAQICLEQVLDRLERDERPRPSLLDTLVPVARPR
jgi:hypothetical protein